jgi:hypothetical protein
VIGYAQWMCGVVEQRDAADEGRLEAYGSIMVGRVIVDEGEVVRPSQLIASVGWTCGSVSPLSASSSGWKLGGSAKAITEITMRCNGRRRLRCVVGATVMSAVALAGCGDNPAASGPATIYQGNWFGTTSQGLPISFTVVGDAITSISFSYSEALVGLPSCSPPTLTGSATRTPTPPILIVNGAFADNCGDTHSCGVPGVEYDIIGNFSSATAVSGTMNFSTGSFFFVGVGCAYAGSADWNATKRQ